MSYALLDGKKLADKIKAEIKMEVDVLRTAGKKAPHLAAILVGNDGGSEAYVGHKVKACDQVGFESTLLRFPDTVTENDLLKEVAKLNADSSIDGFIVQLPLPKHIDADKVLLSVAPQKDVDGFHPVNVGRLTLGLSTYVSATPLGIMTLLNRNDIDLNGKHAVVIGRSNIVGRPLSILLSQANATVTVCHSKTKDLAAITQQADVLVAALGRPGFVTAEMVKPGAVVIDVGTTRVDDATKKSGFRLSGDVQFDAVAPKCSFITPVPGGVGPMTVVSLLFNTLQATKSTA